MGQCVLFGKDLRIGKNTWIALLTALGGEVYVFFKCL